MGMRVRAASLASLLAYLSVAVVALWELTTTHWHLEVHARALAQGRVHPQAMVLAAHVVCLGAWSVIAVRAAGHLRTNRFRASRDGPVPNQERQGGLSGMLALACAGVMPTLSSPATVAPAALPVASIVLPSVAVVEVRRSRRPPSSVEEVGRSSVGGTPARQTVIVRVFGHPRAEGPVGQRAAFRKSRSLELLVWLCLNRDRQRRSTARTAIWDVDIGDASFATVVSEMRRALAEVAPGSDPQSWCPSSYTDEMMLSEQVQCDAELLAGALVEFRADAHAAAGQLTDLVAGIRDIPFAGAGYLWPDVDGTTTRLMILGLDAATELADWSASRGDVHTALVAISAGLRLMPGDSDLLERQQRLVDRPTLSPRSTRRHLVRNHEVRSPVRRS